MNEVELKFRCDDLERVRQKAEALGFSLVSEKRQKDSYVIAGEQNDEGLRVYVRVREEAGTATLEHHTKRSEIETEELEVPVGDPADALLLLERMGYPVRLVITKHRRTLARGDMRIMLDHVEELGAFVEIEVFGTKDDESRLRALAEQLGLSDLVEGMGYVGLALGVPGI